MKDLILAILFFQFSGPINCITVRWSNFNNIARNVYVDPHIPSSNYNVILHNIPQAKERVAQLFGSFNAEPTIIVVNDIDTSLYTSKA